MRDLVPVLDRDRVPVLDPVRVLVPDPVRDLARVLVPVPVRDLVRVLVPVLVRDLVRGLVRVAGADRADPTKDQRMLSQHRNPRATALDRDLVRADRSGCKLRGNLQARSAMSASMQSRASRERAAVRAAAAATEMGRVQRRKARRSSAMYQPSRAKTNREVRQRLPLENRQRRERAFRKTEIRRRRRRWAQMMARASATRRTPPRRRVPPRAQLRRTFANLQKRPRIKLAALMIDRRAV